MKREHPSKGTAEQDDGGGKSRAAKKRAKKKEKKGQSIDPKSFAQSQEQRRDRHSEKPIVQQKVATATTTASKEKRFVKSTPVPVAVKDDSTKASEESKTNPLLQLPLLQLLLVNGVKANNDDNDEDSSSHLLHDMTARERAKLILGAMLAPAVTVEEFYNDYWEKKPLLVRAPRGNNNNNNSQHQPQHRFDGLLSLASLKDLLQRETLCYGRDLNVAQYVEDPSSGMKRRITLDPPPLPAATTTTTTADEADTTNNNNFVAVDPKDVWSNFEENGCTIRLLCPQRFMPSIHSLLSILELEWGCMVGANAYFTPPDSNQGFAPHYDDIEAFCLQLEGRKRWKVYKPPTDQVLPRYSSSDFSEQDLYDMGNPLMDEILEPGDLLYMPRGWIHQACTLPKRSSGKENEHALHLTVSAMQQWAWVDLMEIVMPAALEETTTSSISLREGLPRGFLDYMGAMHDTADDDLPEPFKRKPDQLLVSNGDGDDDEAAAAVAEAKAIQELQQKQEAFRNEAKRRIMMVAQQAIQMIDTACDQIGKRFLSDRVPPALTARELAMTRHHQQQQGSNSKKTNIAANTKCRLVRPGIARLVLEDDKAVLYHCADNSCTYQELPLQPMEFETDDGAALEQLLTTVEPNWICVRDLFHDEIQDKIEIARALYNEGILAINNDDK